MAGLCPAVLVVAPVAAEQPGQGRLVLEVQQMREEMRDLREMVEDQQREIERLRERQRDQYLDLDRRLQEAGTTRPQAPAEPFPEIDAESRPDAEQAEPDMDTPPVIARPDAPEVREPIVDDTRVTPLPERRSGDPADLGTPTEEEQDLYDEAFRALRELRYADAADGFTRFVEEYPDSAYAPNAQYWLGETFYVTRDFETALVVFRGLLDLYPGSNKEGDALLKIGFSHYELREWTEARAALEQVKDQYEGTTLARLAENRLRAMRLEGHL